MFKLSLFKNKKSAVEVSLIHLLEVVLAIGVVLLLIYLSLKISGLFIGRQEYDSAINNLEALSIRVKELIKDNKDISSQTMVYTIPNNYILVGFSYSDKGEMGTKCMNEKIVNSRSRLCQGKSCLCIYQNFLGSDFDGRKDVTALRCKPFDQKIVFLTPTYDKNFFGTETAWKPIYDSTRTNYYLVIYGQCVSFPSWGIKQISIEKHKEGKGENENIFISIKEISNKKTTDIGGTYDNIPPP